MKKGFIVILSLVSTFLLLNLAGCSNNNSVSKTKTITIGTTAQTYPNTYEKDNKLNGFDIDVTNAIAKKIGYKVKWEVIGDLPGTFGALDSGKIDTIANAITVLPEREKNYYFSTDYSYYPAQVAVLKNSKIKSVKDLEGKTVSATIGSSNINLLKKYDPKVNIKTYEDRNGVFTDAADGKVSAALNQRQFLEATIKKQNLPLRIINENIGINKAAFPFKKNSNGNILRNKFNKAINELKQNGTLKKLSEKYFQEDITKK